MAKVGAAVCNQRLQWEMVSNPQVPFCRTKIRTLKSISACHIRWLGLMAFKRVLNRKQVLHQSCINQKLQLTFKLQAGGP